MKLYKKNEKGVVQLKEVVRTSFYDEDAYQSALSFWYGEGWCDTYEEANA